MGIVLIKLNREDEALAAHNKAIELDPKHATAHFNRACCYSELKEKDLMLSDLKMAIDLDSRCKELAKTDEDFKPYWDDPDFKKLVE